MSEKILPSERVGLPWWAEALIALVIVVGFSLAMRATVGF